MQSKDISPNFQFLICPRLSEIATSAEKYCLSDPTSALILCRKFAELCTKYALAESGEPNIPRRMNLADAIKKLKKSNIISTKLYFLLENVRKNGNNAAHDSFNTATPIEAAKCVRQIHKIAAWYHYKFCETIHQQGVSIPAYVIPMQSVNKIDEVERTKIESIKQDVESFIESSDLNQQLSRIASETSLNPQIFQTQVARGQEIDRQISLDDLSMEEDKTGLEQGLVLRGRYRIVEQIGRGSFGTTYVAQDLQKPNEPLCVVKQLTPSRSDQGTLTTCQHLFRREAEVLSNLKHPEIPSLQASFEEDNQFFLVQDYIVGNTLSEEMESQWQATKVVQLLKDILIPLKYVHKHNIVHRDLKPDNLMRRAEDDKIVIIDFGAVKEVVEIDTQGTVIGTRGYMSPEQGRGHIYSGCDVYAVGIIAIEALTGQKLGLHALKQAKEWIEELQDVDQGFKKVLILMVEDNISKRYANAEEALDAITEWEKSKNTPEESIPVESVILPLSVAPQVKNKPIDSPVIKISPKPKIVVPVSNPAPSKSYKKWWITSGVALIALVAMGATSLPYFTKVKLAKSEITIGTLWKPESSQSLADYLEANTVPANYFDYLQGKKIKFRINGDSTLDYKEATKRMEAKQWDIAFTTSPILSIAAKDYGYRYIAGMFPDSAVYQSGLFVRQDSPIQSLQDIRPNTKIALGAFTSASSFYMPVYDLYGKAITANIGNRGSAIIQLVKEGKADVGSAAIGDSVRKDDPNLRIIYVSRDIPGAGVYASPSLSTLDQQTIKQLMLAVPESVRKNANYGDKAEPDYTEFKKIVERVEDILVCTDFTKNPVTLGCNDNIQKLKGIVNSVSVQGTKFTLKFSAGNIIYNVIVPKEIIESTFGSNSLTDIQGITLTIKFKKLSAGNTITIIQSSQLSADIKKL